MAKSLTDLTALRDYLKTKDPNERYSYQNYERGSMKFVGCMLTRYFEDRMGTALIVCPCSVSMRDCNDSAGPVIFNLPFEFNEIAMGPRGEDAEENWTYGQALERCEAIIAAQSR